MEENEKKWCWKAILGAFVGFGCGSIIKHVLALFLKHTSQQIILDLIIPSAMIIGIVIVYRMYQKEKDENF